MRFEPSQQLVGVVAVTPFGRHAPRRRVRMREQPEVLELCQLGPDRGRRDAQVGARDERLRADGLARADELLHDASENGLLPFAQLQRFGHLQEILAGALRSGRAGSGEDLGRDPAAEEAAARRERERLAGGAASPLRETELLEPLECRRVDRPVEPA